jgi:20S proteasome alpha/beta subunit
MKEYKAGATGAGRDLATPFIDALYEDGMNLKEAISFGLGGVYKATEGKVDFTAMELATITKKDGFHKLDFDTFKGYVDEILKELKEEEKNTEEEQDED